MAEFEKWIVLLVLGLVIFSLFKELIKPALTFFFATVLLLAFQIVSPQEVLNNLANAQIATIILLVQITAALNKNFHVNELFDRMFSGAHHPKAFLIRMSSYVAILSSFLNNTPVVAMMTPYVYNWCKNVGAHPSKLLIPLSFSTILGGMITVLGTSTNLVLNGFLSQNNIPTLQFSDFFFLGITVTVIGIIYLYTLGYRLLPINKEAFDDVKAKAPEYLVETEVDPNGKMVGQEVNNSGVNSLNGAYLIELHRQGEVISPVSPTEVLAPNDLLIFMGKSDAIMEMVNSGMGLRLPSHDENQEIVEAVLPANSSLAGKTILESNFQKKYDAELVAISRNGEKISGKMDEVKFLHGDLLLLSVSEKFLLNAESQKDFYVLSKLKTTVPPPRLKLWLTGLLIIGVVLATFLGYFPNLFTASVMILGGLMALNLYNFQDVRKELDLDLVIVLVSALTIGNALIKSGAADLISTNFVALFYPLGVVGIIVGLFILTVTLTSFVTNVAAVSVAFPLAYSITQELQVSGTPFYVAIAFAASAAFLTPIGYQTNWMVYGPGGYTSKDFFKVGAPLAVIYAIVCITFIVFWYQV